MNTKREFFSIDGKPHLCLLQIGQKNAWIRKNIFYIHIISFVTKFSIKAK